MNLFLSFDGNNFTQLEIYSNYGHEDSYFSTYQSKPLIIGGWDDDIGWYHKKTEILENGGTAEQRWVQMADYPYGSK